MSTLLQQELSPFTAHNSLPLNGTDHIEFYVGNARQASYFYRMAFGMRLVAYAGPETGTRDRASFVLQQGKIRFVLTTPLRPDNEMADHIHRHGDGVRDVALCVDDVRQAWREATRRGARSVREPFELKDSFGTVKLASIAAYGDTVHTFVERHNYCGVFLPGYREFNDDTLARSVGLTHVDHMVANVGWNGMNRWAKFYSDVLGFDLCQNLDARDMPTECSTPISKVMARGKITFPIHEPGEGPEQSQERQYLEFYHGPGVQRIALATDDILYTVSKMRERGVDFLKVPRSYYADLQSRAGRIDEPIGDLERLGILVDRDDNGYMLQALTRPVEDRPTLF